MLINIAITIVMIIVTTAVHAGGMMLAVHLLKARSRKEKKQWYQLPMFAVSGIVILMFCVSLIESFVWAIPYLVLNVIDSIEKAIYFSMVTYTTVGYGDVVLPATWRLLSSFQAANGIIMFGWTTAIVMTAIREIYFNHKH